MLVYVASYPQSGINWLSLAISMNWRFLTSNAYPANWRKYKSNIGKYQAESFPVATLAKRIPKTLKPYLVGYICPISNEKRLMLKPNCLQVLKTKERRYLAKLPHKVFIKTHELPPENPLVGESAILAVRNPLDAIIAMDKMEKLNATKGDTLPAFMNLVKGHTGSTWAEYHEKWLQTDMPVLSLKIEDAFADEANALNKIKEFLQEEKPANFEPITLGLCNDLKLERSKKLEIPSNAYAMLRAINKKTAAKHHYTLPEAL